ncbi:DNA-directed RNA polymerase I subunit RPA2-like isoform X3 [Halichondria panicea]|uniref:DNA-directed RNA polymerase I subunit RPA2-like isoform X3 n=1 Tax=Halichondria panicea TaxID=6063 RepID=UPI00312B3B6A
MSQQTKLDPPNLKHLRLPEYSKLNERQRKSLQDLVRHHVESFNFMLEEGLGYAVQNLPTVELLDPSNRRLSLFIEEASIGYPTVPVSNHYAKSVQIFPSECRQRAATYRGKLSLTVKWMVDGSPAGSSVRFPGQVPIMVKSNRCRLANLGPKDLIKHHEEAEELGGYFIVNGNERLIRMLIMPRRNYPLAIVRPSWKTRGPMYTQYGIIIRCVRKDQTAANLTLHYLTDGSCMLQFSRNREMYYVPVVFVLKALLNTTDVHIYNELMKGNKDNTFLKGCVAAMLRSALDDGLTTQQSVLKFIGERFRVKMADTPAWVSDEDITRNVLKELVLVHLDKDVDKFNMLVLMTHKLFALASGKCCPESSDSPANQEVLLGGHLYLMAIKEKLGGYLNYAKSELEKQVKMHPEKFDNLTIAIKRVLDHAPDVGQFMEYVMATGNLKSRSGLGLQQQTGFTVVADKLNFYRYLSHFRAVHRGAFFSQMRTTTVRKLLPEAWGFLCPVHTPDGAPCGLLNHLAAACQVTTCVPNTSHLPRLLVSLGMTPTGSPLPSGHTHTDHTLPVVLDGRIIGEVDRNKAQELTDKLRTLKCLGKEKVPSSVEIGLVPHLTGGQFPGLFLFATPSRMMRPVLNLATHTHELIGSFEQVYMDIAVVPEEAHEGHTSHLELDEGSMFSALATLTPFSDFNQSPRNMYQCQGYDMEDAMILNKGSVERGFKHATVYKSEMIDISNPGVRDKPSRLFGVLPGSKEEGKLEQDGFPQIGTLLKEGDPYYSYFDLDTKSSRLSRYKSMEPAFVDQVKLLGTETGDSPLQKAFIKLRICRNPIIGDKFASRAGQKGICSQRWPSESMPFTESGMVPDIIFNPHGFPSRMTIGMMIEMMAGKSSSLHGLCHDCTPFKFSEKDPAVDHFGKLLVKAGYNYFGNERLYSGINGREFEADIFMGVVYYQRLRHMVSDKFQVRTTGPIDILTHQPVQGRRRAGGIRFGEMERDSLLAHGASFLLQDRLLNCSDKSFCRICKECGSIVSPMLDKAPPTISALSDVQPEWRCRMCQDKGQIDIISVPYVFRYLVAELAAMNIKVQLEIS